MKRFLACLLIAVMVMMTFAGCNAKKNKSKQNNLSSQSVTEDSSTEKEESKDTGNQDQKPACVHTGGTATCSAKAVCSKCGSTYGELKADNHTKETVWLTSETNHKKIYICCEVVEIAEEAHKWENGICTECRYGCAHKGGEANCKAKAVCEICGSSYGELDKDNHEGTEEWTKTETGHTKAYTCCNEVTVETEDHEWENGICTECGYGCAHTGGEATCIAKAVCEVCGQPYGEIDEENHEGIEEWTQTETKHTKAYTCCNVITVETEDHEWGVWHVTTEPTCYAEGSKYHVCTICEYAFTEVMTTTSHNVSEEWSADDSYHWHACLNDNCEAILDKISHTWNSENTCIICKQYKDTGVKFAFDDASSSYSVVDYTGSASSVIIPSIYKGYSVTKIDNYAFRYTGVTHITLPSTVEIIRDYAFTHCTDLISVKFAENSKLSQIGCFAFMGCFNLKSITIPNGVAQIYSETFFGCHNLTSITIGEGVTKIGADIFENCPKLDNIEVDTNNTAYKSMDGNLYTKDGKTLIRYAIGKTETKFSIPDEVEIIGKSAFEDCCNLESITISRGVTNIESYAFESCYKLIEVINKSTLNITKGSTEYGDVAKYALEVHNEESKIVNKEEYVFYTVDGKNYLVDYRGADTELSLPENYNGENYVINKFAFHNNKITSVIIVDGVTSISNRAFSECYNLMSVTIGESITSIDSAAFPDSYKLVEVINKSKLTIKKGFTDNGCIGRYAFEIHEGNSKIVNKEGYIFYTYDGINYLLGYVGVDTELMFPENYNGENYEIYAYAFYDNYNITSTKIPSSVTSIGNYAFEQCDNLRSVMMGSGVLSIGYNTFAYCSNLRSINIPNSVTSIASYAFHSCYGLTSITIPDSVTSIGSYSFYDCVNLTSVKLSNSINSIGTYIFYNCDSLENIEIPYSVTSIGSYAFHGCTSLTSVTFANKSGWKAGETSISSTDLENLSTAATYLKSTYGKYYWERVD